MKSLTSSVIHFIAISTTLFLFSCDRANDGKKTSIVLSLPNPQAIQKFSNSITQFGGASITGSGYTFGPLSGAVTSDMEITPAIPSGGSIADFIPGSYQDMTKYEGYCYLVVVSNKATDDSSLNSNYCGRRKYTRTGTSLIDDTGSVSAELYFGSAFMGLVDASTSSTVNLGTFDIDNVPRVFTVVGFPATSSKACNIDLASQAIDKSLYEQPRIIAQSDTINLSDAVNGELVVDVKINTTDTSKPLYDDCVITDTNLNYPVADSIKISQDNFPYTFLRSVSATDSAEVAKGYVCQPVDFALQRKLQINGVDVDRSVPAALVLDTDFELQSYVNGTWQTVKTFNTHKNCVNDSSADNVFRFSRNRPNHKRWFQVTKQGPGSAGYRAYTADNPNISFTPASFGLEPKGFKLLDNHLPLVMQMDVCYKVFSSIRNIANSDMADLSVSSTNAYGRNVYLALEGSSSYSGQVNLYVSESSCNANSPSPIPFSSSSIAVEYYLKINSGNIMPGTELALRISPTSPIGGDPFVPIHPVYTAANTQATDLNANNNTLTINNIGFASAQIPYGIRNVAYNMSTSPTAGCYPLFVGINNRLGAAIASSAPSNFYFSLKDATTTYFKTVPLRYQRVDVNKDGNVGGYDIIMADSSYGGFNPTTCTYTNKQLTPVTPTNSGSPVNDSNGTHYELYIKTWGSTDIGKRRIQFYYGGDSTSGTTVPTGYPIGQIDFELTDGTF